MSQVKTKPNNKILLIIFVSLIVLFIALQLYTLSSVGTKGEQVSYLKRKQSEVKIENEIRKAQILELQSNQAVLTGLVDKIPLQEKNIISIDPDFTKISALGN